MNATALRGIMAVALLTPAAVGGAQTRPQAAPNRSDEVKAIESRLVEIQDAAQKLDIEKVFSFVLENDKGALVQDGELYLTRKEALDSTRQGFRGLRDVSYQFDQQLITLLSPTVALAVGEGVSTATTNDGKTFSNRFAQSVVLIKTDGQWKVAHAHRSFPARQ